MRSGFVQIEDGPAFPAMIEEGGWNGWAVPYFSRETAKEVLRAYAVAYDAAWHGDVLVMWDSCDELDKERVIVDSTSVDWEPYYGIGAGSWIWSEVERG